MLHPRALKMKAQTGNMVKKRKKKENENKPIVLWIYVKVGV